MTDLDLWYGTRGPHEAPIVLVGESWGSEEKRAQKPFVGMSGTDLDRMLASAGVPHDQVLFTNLVADQPPHNETWRFFTPKSQHLKGLRTRGLAPSDLVRSELARLYSQIAAHPRRVVIAAGNWSLWAFSDVTGAKLLAQSNNRKIATDLQTWAPSGILSWRGSMMFCNPISEFVPDTGMASTPLLPIVHPAAIQRAWYLREPTVHDLKVRVQQALRSDWRPDPWPIFLAPPTYEECVAQLKSWLSNPQGNTLAVDIETARTFITCLGIADSPSFAMSIPFVRKNDDNSFAPYWTVEQEAHIIHLLRLLFLSPLIKVQGQNFIYDTQYIQHYMAVTPICEHDTMLAQNVVFPGTPKDLGYLSSLYCTYHWYWKEDHKEWDLKGTLEQLLLYNCWDCVRTWEIAQSQKLLIKHLDMEAQMILKMQTHDLCLRMMNRGVLIDRKKRDDTLYHLAATMSALQTELLDIVPQELVGKAGKRKDGSPILWFNSDKQTKALFYDFLGFKTVSHRKTDQPTSGKEALMKWKQWYPEFTPLIDRLDLYGSVDNTVQVLRSPLDHDNRMRCSYNPGGTETHRLSSSANAFGRGTNLQNLTKGEEDE